MQINLLYVIIIYNKINFSETDNKKRNSLRNISLKSFSNIMHKICNRLNNYDFNK